MDSKSRRIIKKWIKQEKKDRKPVYIAEGFVFMYPAKGTQDVDHYPVIWLTRKTPKGNVINEFMCGCRGWWYSEDDECTHVKDLKKQIEAGKLKLAAS